MNTCSRIGAEPVRSKLTEQDLTSANLDGLYTIRFRTPLDDASGVVVVIGDTVYGGDTGMYYFGKLARLSDGKVSVNVEIRRHNEATHSVFGDFDGFKMTLTGFPHGEEWKMEGRADAAPSLRFEATLRRAKL